MNFEYGCKVLNRYDFLLDKEDADPNDLLAQAASTEKSSAKDAKTTAQAKGKQQTGKAGARPSSAKDSKDSKDAKKQPLQQQKDNSTSQQNNARQDSGMQLKILKKKSKNHVLMFFNCYHRQTTKTSKAKSR